MLAIALAAGLLLAPSALAKGPHAILSSGPEAVKAGKTWHATLELMETSGAARPVLLARHEDRIVAVRGRTVESDGILTRYELDVVLPVDGRWRVAVVDRKRRFEFPAVAVGGDLAPRDYVAFPKGSMAERQGGGGPYDAPEQSVGHGEPLPPETVSLADPADGGGDTDDGGGLAIWVFPLAGLALAASWRRWSRRRPRPSA